jgi:hypothetical protein
MDSSYTGDAPPVIPSGASPVTTPHEVLRSAATPPPILREDPE